MTIHYDAIRKTPSAADIKALRKKAGLTQTQMAQLLGLSSMQLISDYERGIKSPSDQTYSLMLLLTDQHDELFLAKLRR